MFKRFSDDRGYVEPGMVILGFIAVIMFGLLGALAVVLIVSTQPGTSSSVQQGVAEQFGADVNATEANALVDGRKVTIEVDGVRKLVEFTGVDDGKQTFELSDAPPLEVSVGASDDEFTIVIDGVEQTGKLSDLTPAE